MKKRLLTLVSVSLLLAACGGSDTPTPTPTPTPTAAANPGVSPSYKCPATAATDAAYNDTFIAARTADRDWGADTPANSAFRNQVANYSVDDIANQFNAARALDPTINEKLIMPSQASWDSMSVNDKGLFLVNSERCARGILPLEGSISNMTVSAGTYAAEISSGGVLTHGDKPVEAIKARMATAGVIRSGSGINSDFIEQNESLALVQAGGSPDRPTLDEVQARAVYDWIYDDINDQGSGYGHRTHVLRNDYIENSGVSGMEGLFGLATTINSDRTLEQGGNTFLMVEGWTVLHSFDPNSSFNMGAISASPVIFGPRSQADCETGSTFTEKSSDDGLNMSTCE